jgi:hypothetical protein
MPPTHFLWIHLNITLPSTPGSSKWSLSLRFPHQNPAYDSSLPHKRYMPHPFILLDFITRIILGEDYRSFRSSLCIFYHSPVTPFLLGLNILLNTLFSNTLSLRIKTPYILLCERIFKQFFCEESVTYLAFCNNFRSKIGAYKLINTRLIFFCNQPGNIVNCGSF